MKILIFALLLSGFLLVFSTGHISRFVGESIRKTGWEMDEATRKRVLEERRQLQDIRERGGFLTKVERELYYSGIKIWLPKMTAELFVAVNIAMVAFVSMVGSFAGGSMVGIFAAILCVTTEYLVFSRLKVRNLKRTSENLMKLLDFLGNYSVTSGEVAGILHQVSRYMENPLKEVLETCYYEAQTTGDSRRALLQMAERVEHLKFKELVHNMEVSLRYCADFSALVSASRRSLLEFLRSAGERKTMLREALISMGLLLGMSFVILIIVGSLVQMSPIQLLVDTVPGNVGIVILAVIAFLFAGQMHRVHY